MPRHPRVLIVDYSPKNIRSVSDLLKSSGYQVEVASDGIAALAIFRETHPDLVLLEAMIPKKHGFEVCQEIKKTPEGKTTPVIIMTAVYKGRKYRTQAMHVHGCDEYLEKPCPPEALMELITRFVPIEPDVMQAVASGAPERAEAYSGEEKLGEVIPFPSARAGRSSQPAFPDNTEDEIMSRLDEILPDTPIFDDPGAEESAAAETRSSAPAIDFELEPEGQHRPPSPGGEAGGKFESRSEPGARPKPTGFTLEGAGTTKVQAPAGVGITPRVTRLEGQMEPAPQAPSPTLVVCFGIAIVTLLLWWLTRT